MKRLVVIAVLALVGCGESSPMLTYEQLASFNKRCPNQAAELKLLRNIQQVKNFAQDPDELDEDDRAYNSKLKATIWWYAQHCNNEKNSTPVVPD